jgi:hypothetical protein
MLCDALCRLQCAGLQAGVNLFTMAAVALFAEALMCLLAGSLR